jgi:hypothetical protein
VDGWENTSGLHIDGIILTAGGQSFCLKSMPADGVFSSFLLLLVI